MTEQWMVQVKGQSTHSPVGLGVPEAHQCPEDKRQKNRGEVFQDCSPSPHTRLITLTLSPEAPGGPGSPLGPRGPSCPGSPCGRDRFAEGSAPQPLGTLELYLVTRATGYFPDLKPHTEVLPTSPVPCLWIQCLHPPVGQ